jgi:hypothetical protein
VERVSKINDWRTAEAEKAERAGMVSNLTAAPRLEVPETKLSFVDKPGMKWIDIPETTFPKNKELCTTIGKQGGWCTGGDTLAKSYGSGSNRLTALLDAEGRPHAQAMIKKESPEMQKARYLGQLSPEQYDSVLKNNGPKSLEAFEEWAKSNPPKQDISELKPVGNTFDSARAREYDKRDPQYRPKITESVLKFLNSGDWGKVNDLHHYDIVDMNNPNSVQKMLEDVLGDYHLSSERAELFNEAVDLNPNAPRFMSRSQFSEFVTPPSAPAPDVKPKGFAKGGSVHFAKSVDDMRYELTRKK